MTACPSCFQQLPENEFGWVCVSGKGEQRVDEIATEYLGEKVSSGPFLTTTADQAVSCAECSEPMSAACPLCHYPIASDWRQLDVTTIAMNGSRFTGKSFYIAVVIQQLKLFLAHDDLRSTLGYFDDRTKETYQKNYWTPLYKELKQIASTPRAKTENSYQRHPLIFTLGKVNGKRRHLVIRDVAGEDMEKASGYPKELQFLRYADGVFFMFDPLAVPTIRNYLQGIISEQAQGNDPREVLDNLLRLMGSSAPRLAIIISKFDALQALRQLQSKTDVAWKGIVGNAGAAFMRDPSLTKAHYDTADGELVSLEIMSLMEMLGSDDFAVKVKTGEDGQAIDHRFFAISTLGASPEDQYLSPLGIAPFRVVDPLKWVLHGKGVLPQQ